LHDRIELRAVYADVLVSAQIQQNAVILNPARVNVFGQLVCCHARLSSRAIRRELAPVTRCARSYGDMPGIGPSKGGLTKHCVSSEALPMSVIINLSSRQNCFQAAGE
jgi:hypothetical protein